ERVAVCPQTADPVPVELDGWPDLAAHTFLPDFRALLLDLRPRPLEAVQAGAVQLEGRARRQRVHDGREGALRFAESVARLRRLRLSVNVRTLAVQPRPLQDDGADAPAFRLLHRALRPRAFLRLGA